MQTYDDLANPRLKGQVCSRSGSHPYNLSLRRLVDLPPRRSQDRGLGPRAWSPISPAPPKGGDTDQIKAVAAGECGVALTNTYYVRPLLRSTKPEDERTWQRAGGRLAEPADLGHARECVRRRRGEDRAAPAAAVKFLEYLASDEAQGYFADGNDEWPVVKMPS